MTTLTRLARAIDSRLPAMMPTMRVLIAAALVAVASIGSGFAQTERQTDPSLPKTAAGPASSDGKHDAKAETTEGGKPDGSEAARTKLLADTHLLLTMSRELQAEAAKTTPNTFSLGLVKKSEQIQKLAAKVRAEMAKLE